MFKTVSLKSFMKAKFVLKTHERSFVPNVLGKFIKNLSSLVSERSLTRELRFLINFPRTFGTKDLSCVLSTNLAFIKDFNETVLNTVLTSM